MNQEYIQKLIDNSGWENGESTINSEGVANFLVETDRFLSAYDKSFADIIAIIDVNDRYSIPLDEFADLANIEYHPLSSDIEIKSGLMIIGSNWIARRVCDFEIMPYFESTKNHSNEYWEYIELPFNIALPRDFFEIYTKYRPMSLSNLSIMSYQEERDFDEIVSMAFDGNVDQFYESTIK